ncbi:phage baseplate plug family protein [Novacetimonas pomaceti]|uniref:phage baseplate plug family protein n=1 Tax=Novacetimonas pomaceti TaxID=2021998 RepID=UPI001C2CFD2C|nr:hypothetical protein [Novacetimonas pomaceti]MBV1833082.1 hypothetical protein [Novacetimonas pomaceti]
MTAYVVPISPISRQSVSVSLGQQSCQVTIDARPDLGVFVSVWVGTVPVVLSSLARDRVGLVRYAYTGFVGELKFMDTQGTDDPDFTGFGDRWILVYDDAAVLA